MRKDMKWLGKIPYNSDSGKDASATQAKPERVKKRKNNPIRKRLRDAGVIYAKPKDFKPWKPETDDGSVLPTKEDNISEIRRKIEAILAADVFKPWKPEK
jgi:hypothetical protein